MYNTGANVTFQNSIFWGNAPDQIVGFLNLDPSSKSTVSYSDVEGGWPGIGNIIADPLFVDAGSGDLRLTLSSPAIDAGHNDSLPEGVTTDLDGNRDTETFS